MAIAKNLEYLMKTHRVSESELARALETSVMTVHRIVSGETEDPRISTVKRMADYFNVSVDYLIQEHQQASLPGLAPKSTRFIPILDWDAFDQSENLHALDLSHWKEWYAVISDNAPDGDNQVFALRSRPSMAPRFPAHTLFLFNQSIKPIDGDLVLVQVHDSRQLSLRELIIDAPRWQLQPLVPGSDVIFFDETQQRILGVVVLIMMHSKTQ